MMGVLTLIALGLVFLVWLRRRDQRAI